MEHLAGAWTRFTDEYRYLNHTWESLFGGARTALFQIDCSADDVHRFALVLPALIETYGDPSKGQACGLFLSSLIYDGRDERYTLDLSNWPEPIIGLAGWNRREVEIIGGRHVHLGMKCVGGIVRLRGDADEWAGCQMRGGQIIIDGFGGRNLGTSVRGGSILVKGDTGHYAGRTMRGGEIAVLGDSLDHTGMAMSGGTIRIAGNAGKHLGRGMIGGEIHVNGEIESLGTVIRGRIYNKGKLIVDK
jgi:hypothetical protein